MHVNVCDFPTSGFSTMAFPVTVHAPVHYWLIPLHAVHRTSLKFKKVETIPVDQDLDPDYPQNIIVSCVNALLACFPNAKNFRRIHPFIFE